MLACKPQSDSRIELQASLHDVGASTYCMMHGALAGGEESTWGEVLYDLIGKVEEEGSVGG